MKSHCIACIVICGLITASVYAAEQSLSYDANGNLVAGDGKYRTYNSLNQLWKVYNGSNSSGAVLEEYVYHPSEERVWLKKMYNSSGSIKETTYYFSKEHVRTVNSSGTYDQYFIYQNGDLIGQKNADGSTYFISSDNKGSVVAVTNSSGAVIENRSYDALGNQLSGGTKTRYDYEQQEVNTVIGDIDFNARRYSPSLGIFTSPDMLIDNPFNTQSLNRYMFEKGSPLNKRDPTGHMELYPAPFEQIFRLPFVDRFVDLPGIVDLPVAVNMDATRTENSEGWSDWKYEKFRDSKEKWIRENDKEVETWEEDYSHGKPHINNRIYDKSELNRRDNWDPSQGPKGNVEPKDGPDNHKPVDSKNHDPGSYRTATATKPAGWFQSLFKKLFGGGDKTSRPSNGI